MKQVEDIRQQLQEECEYAQKHTKKLVEKVKAAEARAAAASSQVCQSIHWRLWHRYECLEIELRLTQGRSADTEGTSKLVHDHESSSYTSHEDEEDSDIEDRREEPIHEFNNPTGMLGALNNYNGCAVCGNPITRKFSRCKSFICWRSPKCENLDWKIGHEFQGNVEMVDSDKPVIAGQGRSVHPNVRMLQTRYEEKDSTHSSVPLSTRSSSEGTTNSKLLIGTSQDTNEKFQEEIAQRVRCLEEELAKSRNENRLLKSERGNWDMRAKFVADRLHSYMTESQNQLLIMKHEKEQISNAEKQARDMVQNLSERLHRLQIAEQRKEEYIQKLQNECAKAKKELEEESLSVRTLTMEREEANQRVINALNAVATADSRAADAEACAICLTNEKDMAFGCGHMSCRDCGSKISKCPICRKKITSRVKLFSG
ncbi:hypothetical protein L6164_018087 [Bauhinia variegata]|uniref:Uncharacterized protein n=1 Tax=Bauhinia variegata TaxID=167791 RepID=A0ACB9NA47_BAUVA|nr:hypothetical protein L6164_018087 [Bauhinia variegata]